MDVSTDGFSKPLLKSSLLLCTYFTWLLCVTRKPPQGVTVLSRVGTSTRSGALLEQWGRAGAAGMVGLLGGSLGGCELPALLGLPPGVLGVAHRAVLAPGWRCKNQGCPCRRPRS